MSDYVVNKLLESDEHYNTLAEGEDLNSEDYIDLFNKVQKFIVNNKLGELNVALKSFETNGTYQNNDNKVLSSIVDQYLKSTFGVINEKLSERIIDDMTGYGFLNKYFANSEDIEEININSWDCIWVRYTDWTEKIIDEHFISPEHGQNVILRILQQHGKHMDDNTLYQVSYIGKNVRISTTMSPIVDDDIGVIASIRFVHAAKHTMNELVSRDMLTQEEADLLRIFVNHGVSVCLSGRTNSGKTTVANAMLQDVSNTTRIITIEDGTREFDLVKKDSTGKVLNNVVHLQTRPNKDDNISVNQQDLVDLSMKLDPDIIVISEMVSAEAFSGQEAARTGHTVLTTIHSTSAMDTYYRMFTLGIRKFQLDEKLMTKLMVDAFPIIVYVKKYKDNKRHVQSILEGKYDDGKLTYNELYRYEVVKNEFDDEGNILNVIGNFVKVNSISSELKDKMYDNGLPINYKL